MQALSSSFEALLHASFSASDHMLGSFFVSTSRAAAFFSSMVARAERSWRCSRRRFVPTRPVRSCGRDDGRRGGTGQGHGVGRQLGGDGAAIIGEGGFDLGARAGQIRDRLSAAPKLDEKALYDIQLDAESRFLKRWSELAQSLSAKSEKAAAIAAELKRWNGRADIDQSGHRIARAFRQRTIDQLWLSWLAAADRTAASAEAADKRYAALSFDGRFEYPAWRALTERPLHLLPPPHQSWDEFLVAQLAFVHDELMQQSGSLAQATWGQRNATRIKHPFSRAMPFLSRFLDMPPSPQAGDNHMPRVASPTFGASQRLVVSPGREEQGILTVAGGQSGHPLSPFYGAGHRDWLEGKPTPLLAGETRHTLQLSP